MVVYSVVAMTLSNYDCHGCRTVRGISSGLFKRAFVPASAASVTSLP